MTVQELINDLMAVVDKSKPVYLTDISNYLTDEVNHLVEEDDKVSLH